MENTLTNERKKELLDLVLQQVRLNDHYRGICYAIDCLWQCFSVSDNERYELGKWFKTQKPNDKRHPEFTTNASHFTGGEWWWARSEDGKETRIKFLQHLMSKL